MGQELPGRNAMVTVGATPNTSRAKAQATVARLPGPPSTSSDADAGVGTWEPRGGFVWVRSCRAGMPWLRLGLKTENCLREAIQGQNLTVD